MSLAKTILSIFDFKGRAEEKARRDAAAVQALRNAFNARCAQFKILLSANKRALEIMADMEARLAGEGSFDMSYVRSQSTQASINVYRMITALNSLAGDAYLELYNRFSFISGEIAALVELKPRPAGGPLVLQIARISTEHLPEVGGKMAHLGDLSRKAGINVADGFVITAGGYRAFMRAEGLQEEINRLIQSASAKGLDEFFALSASIQKRIQATPIPEHLESAILQARDDLLRRNPEARLAVRSSAIGEDSGEASFAGQYRTELNVLPEDLLATFKEVLASKYGVSAMTYRQSRGIPDEDVPMCVGCLVMINARAGGVVYSRDPMSKKNGPLVINAVPGLPKSVVDGGISPDVFEVAREPELAVSRRDIANKPGKLLCGENGLELVKFTGSEGLEPSLSDAEVLAVSRLALLCEEFYHEPQDVEWAIDQTGTLVLLQSRPLASACDLPADDGEAVDFAPDLPLIAEGGIVASPGIAAGPAVLVRREADMLKFPEGGVLVTVKAHSRWAPLLCKAAAVVTETGGAAGHLASVAREYGIPAIFNLPEAQNLLDGKDLVTVDAGRRRIYRGRPDALPEHRTFCPLLSGSPVQQTLAKVSQLIVPLNLLFPNSPEFAPQYCRTLHDITRFCHERAVTEFFNTDSADHLRAGKQLVAGNKLQYWVINLDDGFYKPVSDPTVDISNIASRPMLALWQGMVAVPWSGPPATTSRGFMALMAESAANPDLELTRQGGAIGGRNYFLVSRNYCTLQASFGYHFCTVETQCGPVAAENYVNFHFKGGAASLAKRMARAQTLGEIMTDLGFMVDVRQDALFARMEEMEEQPLLDALVSVGHIIIHSRQADTGLGSEVGIMHFKETLRKGLEDLSGAVMPDGSARGASGNPTASPAANPDAASGPRAD